MFVLGGSAVVLREEGRAQVYFRGKEGFTAALRGR
jgi:hypothetical protein